MLRKMGFLSSISTCLWAFVPFAVGFSTFATYAMATGKPLTSQIVFPALSLFSLITFPLAVLPNVLTSWVEAFVSARRLVDYLNADELQKDAVQIIRQPGPLQAGDELVSVNKGEFSWTDSEAQPILHDITLSLKKGDLLSVVGRVGSGKSSLLSAILGEMTRKSGAVKLRGSIAYVSQNVRSSQPLAYAMY